MGYDIRYNSFTGKWEIWEDNELYYDTETYEDAHRVYFNCVMMEPQFDGEPEIDYDLDKGYEPFIEMNLEEDCYDAKDTNLLFISQIL